MNSQRILVVAAHPDDEVLGCGGTIGRFVAEGCAIRIVFMAEGVTARFPQSRFSTPEVQALVKRRNDNAIRALKLLGVDEDVHVSLNNCCRLDQMPQIELTKAIEKHIADFRPTHIFTHASSDLNQDHRLTNQAVLVAARPLHSDLKAVYAFEVLSSTEWNTLKPFAPTAFFDITSTIDKKCEALAAYEGEMRPAPHPRSEEVVRALARYRGTQVGANYAEGFILVRGFNIK